MTTLNEKSSLLVGSCMFCAKESLFVNVIKSERVEVRICDSCLAEAHLTKRAVDLKPQSRAKAKSPPLMQALAS